MTGTSRAAAPSLTLRDLRTRLCGAADEQIVKVLALVDALPSRTSAADDLIAPLRPRLRQLRPQRPLSLQRLLFQPMDPVIVSATQWQPGQPALPRSALNPIARFVRAELGPLTAEIDAALANCTTGDIGRLLPISETLWLAASEALRRARPPVDWREAGLTDADHAALSGAMVAVLPFGVALYEHAEALLPVWDEELIVAMLRAAAPLGLLPWQITLAVLMARLHDPAQVLEQARLVATELKAPDLLAAARPVLALDGMERAGGIIGVSELGQAAEALERIVGLLPALDAAAGQIDPADRRRVNELVISLSAACRSRMATALTDDVLLPMQRLNRDVHIAGGGDAVTAELPEIETRLRQVRRLDLAGRALGHASAHESALHAAADHVLACRQIPPVVRGRLIELLLGADQVELVLPELA